MAYSHRVMFVALLLLTCLYWAICERDGTCLSERDGTCLSERDGTCLSERDGMCLSERDGTCLSERDGTCLSERMERTAASSAGERRDC